MHKYFKDKESSLNNETTSYFNVYIKKRRNESVNVILRHVRVTTLAVQKQEVLHILSVCLQTLLSSTLRACACACARIILSSVASLTLPCFSALSHKRNDFLDKKKY